MATDWTSKILPLRRQVEVTNAWLLERLNTVLPELMRREGFDMWIVAAREYNEDPVLLTLLPAWMLSARRRTILVFSLRADGTVERLGLTRSGLNLKGFYQPVWDGKEDQWQRLAQIVRERNPETIGINRSETFAFGDGLSHTEHQALLAALGPEIAERIWSAERLAVGWLERRLPAELAAYSGIVSMAHALIAEAFSPRVVHPGVTTAEDLAWWLRQRIHAGGLRAWFQPSVMVQRAGEPKQLEGDVIIRPGDLLHCDVGFHYLGLATDNQQMAYVLRPGESEAPAGLQAALAEGNRLQDILAGEFREGATGNAVLAGALARAKAEGIKATIYAHPLGYHGHAAGPVIGLVDMQQGVPGRGDYHLYSDTAHSSELNCKRQIPEWGGQEVMIALEEDVTFSAGQVTYLDGRQTRLHLI